MLVEEGAIELSHAVAVTLEMRGRPSIKTPNGGLVEPSTKYMRVLRVP